MIINWNSNKIKHVIICFCRDTSRCNTIPDIKADETDFEWDSTSNGIGRWFIIIGTSNQRSKLTRFFLWTFLVIASHHQTLRNLGVTVDMDFNLRKHISLTCRCCFYHIHDLRRIRRYISLSGAQTIATPMITSRLVHCNSLLYNIASKDILKPRCVQNSFSISTSCSIPHHTCWDIWQDRLLRSPPLAPNPVRIRPVVEAFNLSSKTCWQDRSTAGGEMVLDAKLCCHGASPVMLIMFYKECYQYSILWERLVLNILLCDVHNIQNILHFWLNAVSYKIGFKNFVYVWDNL